MQFLKELPVALSRLLENGSDCGNDGQSPQSKDRGGGGASDSKGLALRSAQGHTLPIASFNSQVFRTSHYWSVGPEDTLLWGL